MADLIEEKPRGFKAFLARKNIEISAKRYFIDAMGSMALALFATLLMSTIIGTIGDMIFGADSTTDFLHIIEKYAFDATGMALGAAIAYNLKGSPLVIFSATVVGALANSVKFPGLIQVSAEESANFDGIPFLGDMKYAAGPAGVFFVVIIAVELGKVVSKETKVDILVTPLVVIFSGLAASWLLCPLISFGMYWIAEFIGVATSFVPFIMGAVVGAVVGVVLTLPISSAALCSMIFSSAIINGSENKDALYLAAGAAAVGCCCQMVGFAATSFRENKFGGLIAQGLGTSMLQMGNIVKNPRIWIAPTVASAVCGALSTTVFQLKCEGVSAGMGTCGMVGPIGLFSTMQKLGELDWVFWVGMPLLCIILPVAICVPLDILFRKIGWIKNGDQKLSL